jgi:hypothetical protein
VCSLGGSLALAAKRWDKARKSWRQETVVEKEVVEESLSDKSLYKKAWTVAQGEGIDCLSWGKSNLSYLLRDI